MANNNNNRNNNGNQKKRSGAKTGTYKTKSGEDRRWTSGWKKTAGGLISFLCSMTSKSQFTAAGWCGNVVIEVLNKTTFVKQVFFGTMQQGTGKVVCEELGIVINPKAANGGYCGKFTK